MTDFELDQNLSLDTILRDHFDYFSFKYGKPPVYYRTREINMKHRENKILIKNKTKTLPSIEENISKEKLEIQGV